MSFNNQQQSNICLPFGRLGSCRYGINCLNTHEKPDDLGKMRIFVLLNLLPHDFLIKSTEEKVSSIYVSLFNTFNKFGEVRDIIINTNNRSLFIDGNVYVQFAQEGALQKCLLKFSDNLQFNGNFVEINVISQIKDLSEIVCKYYHQSACTNENCTGIHYYKFQERPWEIEQCNLNGRLFSLRDKLIITSHKIWSSNAGNSKSRINPRDSSRQYGSSTNYAGSQSGRYGNNNAGRYDSNNSGKYDNTSSGKYLNNQPGNYTNSHPGNSNSNYQQSNYR